MGLPSFLSGRTQHVKLPGVLSSIGPVIAGVPQGGVILPTLFNVMVNDIEDCIPSNLDVTPCKYADDCTQYELVATNSTSHMQDVTNNLEAWATNNKMVLNENKSKEMWICFKKSCPSPEPIKINGIELERVEAFKLLGLFVRNDLKWNTHIQDIVSRAGRRMYYLRECRRANLPLEVGLTTYFSKFRPLLEYTSPYLGRIAHIFDNRTTKSAE